MTKKSYRTDQEAFWSGKFGDGYIDRNAGEGLLASNTALFVAALRTAMPPTSCIEFGANIGMNLHALARLYPGQRQAAVEINFEAARQLGEAIGTENVYHGSILDYLPSETFDLVLVKGFLIHIAPEYLKEVYDVIVRTSDRYIIVAEYYNPSPLELTYRGHAERLFKRDFAGEMLDRYPSIRLADYGFVYHRDPKFPQDDINWFLLEKRY